MDRLKKSTTGEDNTKKRYKNSTNVHRVVRQLYMNSKSIVNLNVKHASLACYVLSI